MAAGLGVRKLRVTGGEPLVRKDLHRLIRQLREVEGIEDLALTTNGVLLAEQAEALYDAGLRRINIHLDTLDRGALLRDHPPPRFRSGDARHRALPANWVRPGQAERRGLKGVTEQDIVPLARFGRERGIEVRFIEFMPLDAQGLWDRSRVLLADEMIARLSRGDRSARVEVPDRDPRAPATEYRFADGIGKVGFIASVSRPFCGNCNRIRLTADGKLRYCLFAIDETDVKAPAPQRRARRRNRRHRPPGSRSEVGRPRNQHHPLRRPAPPHVRHRRLEVGQNGSEGVAGSRKDHPCD